MRLNLRVWNSGGTQYYLSLYDDDPVNLTKQFTDLQLNKPSGSFSQTFRIPADETNAEFFTNFHEVNSNGDFNPKVKSEAEIEANTVPVIRGYIQLVAVYIENRKPEYEITFFGESASLFREIGDSKLKDLDLSAYDHELTYPNISSSWAGTLFSGDIRYGLIDKGRGWALDGTGRPINSTYPIYPGDWTPFIKVKALVDQIFEDAGFTYSSTFFDSTYFGNLYLPAFNGKLWPVAVEPPETIGFNVGLSALENVTTSSGFYQFTNISDSGNFWDTGSDYTVGADDYWTAPYDGIFTFRAWVSGFNDYAFEDTFWIRFTKNGNNFFNIPCPTVAGDSNFAFLPLDFSLECLQGDLIRFGVFFPESNANRDIDFNGGSAPDTNGGTGWTLVSATAPYQGVDLSMENNMPDIKQKDFLAGLQKMFNLVFVPDNQNAKLINIEPWTDYVGTGNDLDWTEKIDYSKTVSIKPTGEFQKRVYKWQYSAGKDILNKYFEENYEDTKYGNLELEDVQNDFATGEEVVEVPFAAYPCAYIAGSDIVIGKLHDDQLKPITEPKPRITYWGGMIDCVTLTVYDDDAGSNTTVTQYPYFGHYSTPTGGIDEEDLNFNIEFPLHSITGNPNNNLYNKYWRDYVNEYYSNEARLMTAFFRLDISDYYSLQFSDRIFIKDAWWRVLKVNQFQPNKDSLTEVQLIKEIKTPRSCEHIPTGITSGNIVEFENSAGSTTFGSQECCELFGYSWSTANSRCYATVTPSGLNPLQFTQRARSVNRSLGMGNDLPGIGTVEGVQVGARITTGKNNPYSVMVGRHLTAEDDLGSLQLFGDSVYGWAKGLHQGGGSYNEGDIGAKQAGRIVMWAEGDFDSLPSSDILSLAPTLTIPMDSSLGFTLTVIISEWSVSTSRVTSTQKLLVAGTIHRDGAGVGGSTLTILEETGDHAANSISISENISGTDLTFDITNNTASITDPVRITGLMDYTIARH